MPRDYVLRPFRPPVELHINYAGELNRQQYEAVTALPSPALVIAGAGSGKTRTLTYRVAYLLEQGIPPDRILLLTFTNKAAKEMMHRVADLLAGDISGLWGGTFHSIGNRILRRHSDRIGFKPEFTILDREDAKELLKSCIEEVKTNKDPRFPKADVLADILSLASNTRRPIAETLHEEYDHLESRAAEITSIETMFTSRKRTANVMDFDDLLLLWFRLLQDNQDLLELYQRRFQFLLIDEYQDTNKLQSDLIDLIADRHKNVMVVGDDSQSIYSWRGANFRNILHFPDRYPDARVYKIETNYRSTPEILQLANAVIASNTNQFSKRLTASRGSGAKPVVVACETAFEQARFVVQRALELREEGKSLNDLAVLYRSHFHALELQLELTRSGIPFSITSGIRFFEQAHVKDVAAHIKWIANPTDELSYKRLVRLIPGIGGKGADKLWAAFRECWNHPADHPSTDATRPKKLASLLQACGKRAPKKSAVAWAQFSTTISQLEEISEKPSSMIRLILDAGYDEYLRNTYSNYRNRLEDLDQLSNYALQFPTTEEFLSQLALVSNAETDEEKPSSESEPRIHLSTIHQAKGLEFSVAFVIMLCDGLFPSSRSLERSENAEEERRLFYVAITRAKDELYLSYPLIRLNAGYSGSVVQQKSRFLTDIPDEIIDTWNLRSGSY